MKISFIGFGNMAKAIAQGLLGNKKYELSATAPSLPKGISVEGIQTDSDNLAFISEADIIILAVKPVMMGAVFAEIREKLPTHCLVISIAAGIRMSCFTKHRPNIAIVRAMPNTAASIGLSATPLIANKVVTVGKKRWAEQIFSRIGLTTWVNNETEMDAFTALSGSGQAYVFLLMEAMIKTATDLGIDNPIAKSFTLQTFKGAVSLACENLDLAELRQKVTSPAGTTAAALKVLTQHGFEKLIYAAMIAARNRAEELGAQAR